MSASSICVGVLLKLMLPSMGVWLLLLALLPRSPGGESDIVMVLKRPRISRRSCDTWSLGSVVRSRMKFLMDRMMRGQPSSLGNHQSDRGRPHPSNSWLRRVAG